MLDKLNADWKALCAAAAERGDKIRQACDQKSLNWTIGEAHLKLDELERALKSDDLGSDLRGVKELIQKHTMLEQEMVIYDRRIKEIVEKGQKMADRGHFDSHRILAAVKQFTNRYVLLFSYRQYANLQFSYKLSFPKFSYLVVCSFLGHLVTSFYNYLFQIQFIAKSSCCATSSTRRKLQMASACF
jgi:spectrin beta